MDDRRVVVTGLGTINPVGNEVDATWKNLLSGKSGIAPIERIDTTDLRSKIGGEIKDFDVTEYIPLRLARRMDRYAQLFWVAANLAGVCLGASQSAGRALVGYLSPSDRRAEFFGLWGLAVKLSSILGPITYGLVSWISAGNHRLAILITGAYFVIGLALLTGINADRGHRAAHPLKNAPQS